MQAFRESNKGLTSTANRSMMLKRCTFILAGILLACAGVAPFSINGSLPLVPQECRPKQLTSDQALRWMCRCLLEPWCLPAQHWMPTVAFCRLVKMMQKATSRESLPAGAFLVLCC